MLIQLGAARYRGGVESVILGRDTRGRRDTTGQAPFSLLGQTGSAKLEISAEVVSKGVGSQVSASVDPLYLFSCGVLWRRHRDTSAGWELIRSLRLQDKSARAIAAALLAKTEHARLFWFVICVAPGLML